jgi:ABC-2 type transport system ATP-binding protein
MSIVVSGITKVYGVQKALNNVSFEVKSNEITGFLGPNGAGKSTMMKILTCYLPASSGNASVAGFDTAEQSMEVRRRIGYLPEHNPLNLEMYVKEFLEFTGSIYKIRNIRQRVADMIRVTGLTTEQNKKIGALSKGYRQRVGLAQAMIHDPQVLIMDEPTTGLDPNQLAEIRELIRSLGKEKTVMLSTHIMQEVEAICDRVIIINKGEIVADDATGNLIRGSAKQVIKVEFDTAVEEHAFKQIAGMEQIRHAGGNTWELSSAQEGDLRKEIFQFAKDNNVGILTLNRQEQKLEDIFKKLTAGE